MLLSSRLSILDSRPKNYVFRTASPRQSHLTIKGVMRWAKILLEIKTSFWIGQMFLWRMCEILKNQEARGEKWDLIPYHFIPLWFERLLMELLMCIHPKNRFLVFSFLASHLSYQLTPVPSPVSPVEGELRTKHSLSRCWERVGVRAFMAIPDSLFLIPDCRKILQRYTFLTSSPTSPPLPPPLFSILASRCIWPLASDF